MKIHHLQSIVLCVFCITNTSFVDQPNWPQWRGANGSGETSATDVVGEWGLTQNVKWRIELPEACNSTPVVWNDKILYTQPLSSTNQRTLCCVDRETGRELWHRSVTYAAPELLHKSNPFCSASPVTDGERVIAWFGSAGLVCWDFDGNELWRRDLGPQQHMWGYGTSPIMHDGLCILLFGPGKNEFLIAVDKTTGETKWRVDSLGDEAERAMSGPENDGSANDFVSDKERDERLRGAWSTPTVFTPDRTEFKKLAENTIDETTNASVVVAGHDVLVRTDRALWSFTKK